jgi:hypothetical protein
MAARGEYRAIADRHNRAAIALARLINDSVRTAADARRLVHAIADISMMPRAVDHEALLTAWKCNRLGGDAAGQEKNANP